MKKAVSMFVALAMAFTMGPVAPVRAESGKAEDEIINAIDMLEDEIINAMDMVDSCVRHPQICAHDASSLIKNVLDEVAKPGFESVLDFLRNYNYAFIFENALTDKGREKLSRDPEWRDLVKLINEDNVSFSQLCDGLKTLVKMECRCFRQAVKTMLAPRKRVMDFKTLVKMVAANPSSSKDTKEEL